MIRYIIQTGSNPHTSAAYNRVRLFEKGLREKSIKVKIHRIIISSKYGFLERINFFVSYTLKLLYILCISSKKDIIIFYGETYFSYLYKLFSIKTNLIIERNEYPTFVINEQIKNRVLHNSQRNLQRLRYASLLITCSNQLKKYYQNYVADIFISPLIVNLDEFDSIIDDNQEILQGKYIAYCGSFNNNKDGIPNLIEAFAIFHKRHQDFKLVLIGTGDEKELQKFHSLIEQLNIEKYVYFTGALNHQYVIKWLKNANILALARPNNKQAEGGIPSKVGEYLATGVPCVITNVGDLPSYLTDGKDCIISNSNYPDIFATKLEESLSLDRKSIEKYAKETARQFHYTQQVDCLLKKIILKYQYK